MKYISTEAVITKGTEHVFEVCKGNHKFTLAGELAAVWLSGRFAFSDAQSASEIRNLEHLCRMNLAVKAEEADIAQYRALTHCTLVPATCRYPYLGLSALEKTALRWLREAGLRLTIAELVYLNEHSILPTPTLFGSAHIQELLYYLMRNPVPEQSIEYNDNRLSRFCGQYGKCAITGVDLQIGDIHCHHIIHRSKGGSDRYENLILVTENVHRLLHAANAETIRTLLSKLKLSTKKSQGQLLS